jgi:hypothetical protein
LDEELTEEAKSHDRHALQSSSFACRSEWIAMAPMAHELAA